MPMRDLVMENATRAKEVRKGFLYHCGPSIVQDIADGVDLADVIRAWSAVLDNMADEVRRVQNGSGRGRLEGTAAYKAIARRTHELEGNKRCVAAFKLAGKVATGLGTFIRYLRNHPASFSGARPEPMAALSDLLRYERILGDLVSQLEFANEMDGVTLGDAEDVGVLLPLVPTTPSPSVAAQSPGAATLAAAGASVGFAVGRAGRERPQQDGPMLDDVPFRARVVNFDSDPT